MNEETEGWAFYIIVLIAVAVVLSDIFIWRT